MADPIRLTEILTLDNRGRIVIPKNVRKMLSLEENNQLMLEADSEQKELRLVPFYDVGETITIIVTMDDIPGSLAKIAKVFADMGVNLIYGNSRIIKRGKAAEWSVIASAPTQVTLEELRERLLEEAQEVEFERTNK